MKQQHKGASPNYFFHNYNIVTLSWSPLKRHTSDIKQNYLSIGSPLLLTCHHPCVCRNTARSTAHPELLDDRKLYLLSPVKHGAKQCRLYIPTFCWQTKCHVASPLKLPPKRHNDVVWRCPLTWLLCTYRSLDIDILVREILNPQSTDSYS